MFSCPHLNLPLEYSTVVLIFASILAIFYGFWGRDALDYPQKIDTKPNISLAAHIHVSLYHSFGGFIGTFILGYLFKNICDTHRELSSSDALLFILGFMGVMGYLPRLMNLILLNFATASDFIKKHLGI